MTNEKESNKKVIVSSFIPKFIGENNELFGPYNQGDIVELPNKIADLLIMKEKVEGIEKLEDITKNKKDISTLKTIIFSDFYGYDKVKEGLMLTIVSNDPIHVLLVGDPGAGKTLLLKKIAEITDSKIITSFSELENNDSKIICIDAFDNDFLKEDKDYKKIFNKNKSVIMTARPSFGRFDPYETIAKQIDMPSKMPNEFDLIFPIKDMPNKEKDLEIINNVINNRYKIIDDETKKQISSIKKNPKTFSEEAKQELAKYYVALRNSNSEDGVAQVVQITARQIKSMMKLAEAYATYEDSDIVNKKDARKAIELIHYILSQIGLDPETGRIDIDRISIGFNGSKSIIAETLAIINGLKIDSGKNILIPDVIERAKNRNISEQQIFDSIEQLKRAGEIYETMKGVICFI